MTPEMEDFLTKIIASGVTGGTMFAACWWLVKALKEQYEDRIKALEETLKDTARRCEDDRLRLHTRIEELWKELTQTVERLNATVRRQRKPGSTKDSE